MTTPNVAPLAVLTPVSPALAKDRCGKLHCARFAYFRHSLNGRTLRYLCLLCGLNLVERKLAVIGDEQPAPGSRYKYRPRFSKEDRQAVFARDLGLCRYCGTPVGLQYHVDHIKPLAKGGKHLFSNWGLSCSSCNLKKSDRAPTRRERWIP